MKMLVQNTSAIGTGKFHSGLGAWRLPPLDVGVPIEGFTLGLL